MSNLATVTPIRPQVEVVESRVAELEDGYTRTANALLEAVMLSGLTQHHLLIVMAVWRKTYGYNKKMDWIGNEQFAALTGMAATKCSTAKNELIRMGVLTQAGRQVGMNTNLSEWKTKFNGFSKSFTESVKVSFTESVKSSLPNQSNTKDNIQKTIKTITQTHEVGLSEVVTEKPLTPRQLGTNPRATGTNPRSKLPAFDRERLKETWNCKAERFGLPKIRSVTTTVENGIKRLWVSYLKQCKELKREPKDIDSLLNGYLEHGYQPTPWAMGQNPEGKRYGIETALRQEKIDQILGADS
ncbi:replication protein [Cronobacter turicensis]|nr:replication protein [Cronobacter turicensis]ELQ6074661.1 replication protein [Cronobacter turicensis]ELQ6183753.1 replication protein [Cronobacter turicensis]ELQ6234699.1 replication protein [Cronobacter turicensis]ELQ6238579.1 replication protein [Cronobacter turicensis]